MPVQLPTEQLYIHTVYYSVYFQRSRGEVRDSATIHKSPVVGDLHYDVGYWDERPWRRTMRATLLGSDGETYLLPVLDKACIFVRANGLLIEGEEVLPTRSTGIKNVKTDRYLQAWWCVPKVKP